MPSTLVKRRDSVRARDARSSSEPLRSHRSGARDYLQPAVLCADHAGSGRPLPGTYGESLHPGRTDDRVDRDRDADPQSAAHPSQPAGHPLYADHAKAAGYVSIKGRALLVDDRAEMIKRKRAYWDSVFPGFKKLVLIKVIPEQMEFVNYSRGVNSDPATWRAPSVEFTK